MTCREYFEQHENETPSWCGAYTDESEENYLIMYDGEPNSVIVSGITVHKCEGYDFFRLFLNKLARKVNPYYDDYEGFSDEHIAMEKMHPVGCAHCPFLDECDAACEEFNENLL